MTGPATSGSSVEAKRTAGEAAVLDSTPAVKICGVTRVEDARLAVDLGAEFIGLNFYRASPRSVDLDQARRVADEVSADCSLVGIFVNHSPTEVGEIATLVGLDLLQFHGDEPIDQIEQFSERAIRALRFGHQVPAPELARYRRFWALLLDAPAKPTANSPANPNGATGEVVYGGTGDDWDYQGSRSWLTANELTGNRLFLAGGIGPANVFSVLRENQGLFALDLCSGVESEPGVKDPELLQRLFAEVERYREESHGHRS